MKNKVGYILGVLYKYDNVYQSWIGIALSTNFLSGSFLLNGGKSNNEKYKDMDFGSGFDWNVRYRHNGWKANANEE